MEWFLLTNSFPFTTAITFALLVRIVLPSSSLLTSGFARSPVPKMQLIFVLFRLITFNYLGVVFVSVIISSSIDV